MENQEEITKKGIKRLQRMQSPLYIYKTEKLESKNWKSIKYSCLYMEKGVAKYGEISNPFYIRFGPSPNASLKGLHPTKYREHTSRETETEIYDLLYKLMETGELDLPVLDPTTLEYHS